MKKFYITLLFCSCFIQFVAAQTLLSEGFEIGTFPPANWTIINAGSGNNWLRTDNPALALPDYAVYSGKKAAIYEYDPVNSANAWMITPALNLTGGQSYGISFYYRVGFGNAEKLKVTVGKQATVALQDTILWNNDGMDSLTNSIDRRGITQFIPGVSGTYYFGFNCYSDKDKNILLLDSIVVRVAPAAPPACATNVLPVNGSIGNDLNNVPLQWNGTADAYDLYFDTNNPPTTLLGTLTTNQVPIINLAYSTTYYWYVLPYNAAGYAKGCNATNVTSFTTKSTPPPPLCTNNIYPAPNAVNVPVPSIRFSVTPVSGATKYDLYIYDETSYLIRITTHDSASFTYDGLLPNRVYHWYAVPGNDGGNAIGCGNKKTIFTTSATLPVKLLNFNAMPAARSIFLNWTTATEENNSYFEVQRSGDGVKFDDVAKIKTKADNGNSSTTLKYDYEDLQPFPGINYYRLKQVDKDGRYVYSKIITIYFIDRPSVQVFPNPAGEQVRIKFYGMSAGEYTFKLCDISGRTVSYNKQLITTSSLQVNIPLNNCLPGVYFITITGAGGNLISHQKIIKQ